MIHDKDTGYKIHFQQTWFKHLNFKQQQIQYSNFLYLE